MKVDCDLVDVLGHKYNFFVLNVKQGLKMVGEPESPIIALATKDAGTDIFKVADYMETKVLHLLHIPL